MEYFDIGTIIFMAAAAFIFWQLRNVLGRRTGNERPPFDPYSAPRPADSKPADNVVSLPRKRGAAAEEASYAEIDKIAEPGTPLNRGLRAIRDADPGFDPKSFLDGAKTAYEMIVTAFAAGDRKTLKSLLSREVYDDFVAAISEREARGETVQSSFVGVEKAEFAAAEMKGGEAHVSLRLVSQLISVTRDKDGEVVDGDPDTVAEVKDLWTFARDARSRDPNWRLVASQEEDE